MQWTVETYVMEFLKVKGFTGWILRAFQLLFGLATLAPVAFFIVKDIQHMYRRIFGGQQPQPIVAPTDNTVANDEEESE